MEAIILELKDKTVKVKNVDTEKISYIRVQNRGLNKGDVISVRVEKKNFKDGFLFISGEVAKINDTEYFFDDCLCCGKFLESTKPLCRMCWKKLQSDRDVEAEIKVKERKLTKNVNIKKQEDIHKDFRTKWPCTIRARDGHMVRSLPERAIDDFLFQNKLTHIYEKIIPGEKMISDFYLPEYKIYIEYWGMNTKKYNMRREEKIELYKENGLHDNLLNLCKEEIGSIDDALQEKLIKMKVPRDQFE